MTYLGSARDIQSIRRRFPGFSTQGSSPRAAAGYFIKGEAFFGGRRVARQVAGRGPAVTELKRFGVGHMEEATTSHAATLRRRR
jgi:hypothetical protein